MRILVLEDERALRVAITRILERAGHEVMAVADGQAGVDHLAENSVDLVLSDMCMLELNGPEAHARARIGSYDRWIFMSGGCPDEFVSYAQERGLKILAKPIARQALLSAIQRE